MAFQPSGFQPPAKTSLREKVVGIGRAIRVLVFPAKGLALLEETAWQRGKRQAHELANGRAVLFMIICAPIFAVGGLLVLTSVGWPVRVLLAALIGLAVALTAVLLISGFYAMRAPYKQRDEAREYVRALEAHADDYAEWARRREIAYDFRHETLQEARRVGVGGSLMGSVSDEEARWRGNVDAIRAQMREHGADASVLSLLDAQMEALDSRDDGYGATTSAGLQTA